MYLLPQERPAAVPKNLRKDGLPDQVHTLLTRCCHQAPLPAAAGSATAGAGPPAKAGAGPPGA